MTKRTLSTERFHHRRGASGSFGRSSPAGLTAVLDLLPQVTDFCAQQHQQLFHGHEDFRHCTDICVHVHLPWRVGGGDDPAKGQKQDHRSTLAHDGYQVLSSCPYRLVYFTSITLKHLVLVFNVFCGIWPPQIS